MAWDMPSNFSNGTAVAGVGSMFQYGDYITAGWFAEGILLVIFMMVFLAGMAANMRKSASAALFITFIFATYFMRLGMIDMGLIITIVVLFILSLVFSAKEGGGY